MIEKAPLQTRSRKARERVTADELEARQAAIDAIDFSAMLDELEPPQDMVVDIPDEMKILAGLETDDVYVVPSENTQSAFTIQDLQLTFNSGTPYEMWERDTLRLIALGKRISWFIADALAYGEEAYGEKHTQVYDLTSWSKQTLRNITYIARNIPPERRRDDLEFGVQAAVASLTPDQQVAVLTAAAEQDWGRLEVRQAVNTIKRLEKQAKAQNALPAGPMPPSLVLAQGDARRLPLDPEQIDCIITSPPYGIMDTATGAGVKKYAQDDDYRTWSALMRDFLGESWRILQEGGRLIVNVPIDTSVGGEQGGMRPVYAELVSLAQVVGFSYVTTISWDEGNVSNSVARGSVGLPSAPRIINRHEMIVVFSKGQFRRDLVDADGQRLTSDIETAESVAWSDGIWTIPGESNGWEGFRAAYPLEVVTRLLKLFTFREDRVCDPFLGSGTSAVGCLLLGRVCYGYDIDGSQVESAKRRIERVQRGGSR